MAEGLAGRFGSWAQDIGRDLPGGESWSARRQQERRVEELQRQQQLKLAQDALKSGMGPAQMLDLLNEAQRRGNQLNVEQLQATTPLVLGARAAASEQDVRRYDAQSRSDLARESGLLGAKTNAALRVLGGDLMGAERMQLEYDRGFRDQALQYFTAENAANRALQNKQIDRSTTMGLLSSILGAGVIAAALAS